MTQPSPTSLEQLAQRLGLSYQTMMQMMKVTPTWMYRLRRGEGIPSDDLPKIEALVSFFAQLEQMETTISDLGSWIDLPLRDDTILTPAAIYIAGSEAQAKLLQWAAGSIDTKTLLNSYDPAWREHYSPDPYFHVVLAADGQPSIVSR